MTITREIREKVIQMYIEGRGRNEIARLLTGQGPEWRISEGSVGNIIRAYREREDGNSGIQSLQHGVVPNSEVVTSFASTGVGMNNTNGSSLPMARHSSGIGQNVSTTNTNSNSNVIPRDGGPLLHLLCEDNSTDEEEVIPPVTSYSNLPSSVPSIVSMSLYPNTNISSNFNPYFNPYQNNINPQISKPETQESLEPKPQPQPQHQQYHDDNNDSNYDDQEVLDPELKKEFDDSWQKNLFQKIIEGRKERQLIERRQQELDEQKRQIENIRRDLEARENKFRSVEDLITSSKHLKDIGIGFDQALVWVDCIKEVAQKERTDERTAAWKLADMLRSFKELSDLDKAIQQATQQLAMLNMVNDQQKRVITTLAHLQQIGMTEDEIGELVKLVGRWKGVGQGNGYGKLDDKLIGVG